MFDNMKTFVKDHAPEIIVTTIIIAVPAVLAYKNIKLTTQLESTTRYAQAAVRALSGVDELARESGVSIETLNRIIQTAGLSIKDSV